MYFFTNSNNTIYIEGEVVFTGFLRWLGGIVVFFWILGLIFKFAGGMIHILLVVAAVIFIIDWLTGKKRK